MAGALGRASGWKKMLRLMSVFVQSLQTRRNTEILGANPCLVSHRWNKSTAQHRMLLESWSLRHTSNQRGTGILEAINIPFGAAVVEAPFDEYG